MKKQLLTTALLILSAIGIQTASAQNYQPFSRNLTYHFSAQDSIYSLRVDSVSVQNGDSVFVFNKIAKFHAGMPFTPPAGCSVWPPHYIGYANNQFGQRMIKKTNGDYEFVTLQGHQFLLKTTAAIGQSWTFNSALNLGATLTAKTVEPVLTTTDSVLTYNLSNGAIIKLSKNFGFIRTPNFAAYSDNYFPARELNFMALPEKNLGKNYSSPLSYYDYQPGDVLLHYFTDKGSAINCVDRWTKTEIISRTLSPDGHSISYQVNRQILEKGNGCPGGVSGFVLHPATTLTWTINASDPSGLSALSQSYYVLLPPPGGIPPVRASEGMIIDPAYSNKVRYNLSHWSYSYCADALYSPEGYRNVSYVEGVGMVRNEYMEFQYRSLEVLQGYQKDGITSGDLRSFSQIMSTGKAKRLAPAISIFPNPAENTATLKFDQALTSGPVSVSVMNALGQVVKQQEFAAVPDQQVQLSLEKLTKGMYLVQVKQHDKTFTTRLVKQ